jgi:hypothetical protein
MEKDNEQPKYYNYYNYNYHDYALEKPIGSIIYVQPNNQLGMCTLRVEKGKNGEKVLNTIWKPKDIYDSDSNSD